MPNKENKIEKTESELNECSKQRDEYLAGWQRERADFLNYKKEEASRIREMKEYWDSLWILEIIDFYDNLERANQHLPEALKSNDWIKAKFQIEKAFFDSLKSKGLAEIKAMGEQFDPNLHEAIEEIESEQESGIVLEIAQKGYLLNNKLLRPTRVKIAK